MDLNRTTLIWNITSDIDLKATPNGQNVCSFSIATNRTWKDNAWNKQETAEFHNVVCWGKLAEITSQYCKKGQKVYFEWRLQTRSWEAQDGTKRYRTEIVGENLIMLWSKGKPDEFSKSDKEHGIASHDEIGVEDIPF